jgi:SET domain-containing protein
MLAKLFEVKEAEGKGKGLFAKDIIPLGTIICFECNDCRVISVAEFERMSREEKENLFSYAYRKEDGCFMAPCGEGRFENHSCDSNTLTAEPGFDIVVRDIQKGEEVTYDYRCFYDDLRMPCHCGAKNCCKTVTCVHPIPDQLARFWASKIDAALSRVHQVPQPLKEELKKRSIFPLAH